MEKLKLLDFMAPWCGYCSLMEGTIEALAEEYKEYLEIQKINIDTDKELSAKYRVMGVPTYVIIDSNENILGRMSGFQTKETMKHLIDSCLDNLRSQ